MEALHKAIRRAATAQVWSQGVKLVRDDAVTGVSKSDSEIVFRVKAPGRAVAPTVVLYPRDLEWECDCPNSEDTCAHVAAAIIALTQTRKDGGDELPTSQKVANKVLYRFRCQEGSMALERFIVPLDYRPGAGGPAYQLKSTLGSITTSRPADVPEVSPEQADLNVDRILGTRPRGTLPSDRLLNILAVLADSPSVELDGKPVRVSSEAILPRAVVTDHRDGGARVTIDKDPRITEVVAFGVALCGDTLHPLAETQLSGPRLELLPLVRTFARAELGELKTSFLPDLARRIDVKMQAQNIPELASDAKPRIHWDVKQDGHRLTVVPTLVYGDPPTARIDGDRLIHLSGAVPVRDGAAEKWLRQHLRDTLNLQPGHVVTFQGQEAVEFLHKLRTFRSPGQAKQAAKELVPTVSLIPHVDLSDDEQGGVRFDVYFTVAGEDHRGDPSARIPADKVLAAWRDKFGVVLLEGGIMAELPMDWLSRYGHRVADLLAAKADRDALPAFAAPDVAALCADLDRPRPPSLAGLEPLLAGFASLPEAELPADLKASLRPYQERGVRWLSFLRSAGLGGLLADDMGLGKTLQALCAVRGKALVVCPTSVIYNWAAEIERFRPSLRTSIYHGPSRVLGDADVTITTYAILRLDIDKLMARTWDTIILDEAQTIKNPESQVAQAAYRLQGAFRVTLSGTPVENRLDELWSQFHFTNPGLLGGRQHFRERYADPISRGEEGAAASLRTRIRPFVLRRLKQDVAPELPPRTDMLRYCELDSREREVYAAVHAATKREVLDKLAQGGSVMAALEALLRLRQAACHPALLPGQHAEGSSKVAALVDALELVAAEDHKALVFSQWTSLLDLIEPHLSASGIAFARLDGATRDRAGVVARFQDEKGPPVMLISLKAGGTGLNLTAADHVFLCDPWWNPAVEDQAADRAHRIGQERPVMVYRLVAKDTVEERILALQQKKRALADAALGQAELAANLTRDDLLALLA